MRSNELVKVAAEVALVCWVGRLGRERAVTCEAELGFVQLTGSQGKYLSLGAMANTSRDLQLLGTPSTELMAHRPTYQCNLSMLDIFPSSKASGKKLTMPGYL